MKPNEIYIVPEFYNSYHNMADPESSSEDEYYNDSGFLQNSSSNTQLSHNAHPVRSSDDEQQHRDAQSESSDVEPQHGDTLSEHSDESETEEQPGGELEQFHPTPPKELVEPTVERKSVGIAGRLRHRKDIDYSEITNHEDI